MQRSFPLHRPNARARWQLVCFPYAGGGASVYRDWEAKLEGVEVLAFEPPGRGQRFVEPALESIDAMVDAARSALSNMLDRPFAVFGHSLGAFVAWEFARTIGRADLAHLFVSGASAPHVRKKKRTLHTLSDPEFIAALRDLNGTPAEILAHEELMEALLPMLRADFKASETHVFRRSPQLSCALTAFEGLRDDEVSRDEAEAWRELTDGPTAMEYVDGDHFFVHSHRDAVLARIAATLARAPGAPSR